jgi:hypothetical protein
VQTVTPSLTQPSTDLRLLSTIEESQKPKRTTENVLAKAASIVSTQVQFDLFILFIKDA